MKLNQIRNIFCLLEISAEQVVYQYNACGKLQ